MSEQDMAMDTIKQVFDLANQGRLDYSDLAAVANVVVLAGNHPISVLLYQEWLENTDSPYRANVYCDLADALIEIGQTETARQAFENALSVFPGYLRASIGLEACGQS